MWTSLMWCGHQSKEGTASVGFMAVQKALFPWGNDTHGQGLVRKDSGQELTGGQHSAYSSLLRVPILLGS